MGIVGGIAGLLVIFVILWDIFETIILPRRVRRRIRLSRIFYSLTWPPWSALAERFRGSGRREAFLSYFGPLSLILLLVV
jgi:hypothetical protein